MSGVISSRKVEDKQSKLGKPTTNYDFWWICRSSENSQDPTGFCVASRNIIYDTFLLVGYS